MAVSGPKRLYLYSDSTLKWAVDLWPLIAAAPIAGVVFHFGDCNVGSGSALKSFLHWRAVHLAHLLAFFRRALSVEIPVPAYICR